MKNGGFGFNSEFKFYTLEGKKSLLKIKIKLFEEQIKRLTLNL
jgi:hypothetical protein